MNRDPDHVVLRLWARLPVVLGAVVTGVLVGAAGTLPWAALAGINLKYGSRWPWAVPVMALYLWGFWRYFVAGQGWPYATAEWRRVNARGRAIGPDVWGPALMAGMMGLLCVLLLQGVLARLVRLPQQQDLDPAAFPTLTVAAWLAMSAVVAGIVEETSFRGYLQRPIEQRHGPAVAIVVSGVVFAFAHFSHPEVGLILLPFYIAVAATYGALAHLTDSTRPGMVLHGAGNLFSSVALITSGKSEWQLTAAPPPLVWETGADAAFWGNVAALIGALAIAVWAYRGLALVASANSTSATSPMPNPP